VEQVAETSKTLEVLVLLAVVLVDTVSLQGSHWLLERPTR
jgi:hypothetical protein